MVEGFQGLIREVVGSSREVLTLTTSLTKAAEAVAFSSRAQDDASQSMATALEETKASIEQVADNAVRAQQIAEEADHLSEGGRKIVRKRGRGHGLDCRICQKSARYIQTLGDESAQINSIVNVIKEIADQRTSLRSMRPLRPPGRGNRGEALRLWPTRFASLLKERPIPPKEISAMIARVQTGTAEAVSSMNEGSAQVAEGVELANKAGESMSSIREGAERVISAVRDITGALKEQEIATQLIVDNVTHIVEMADKNCSETEGIALTAENLDKLAHRLQQMVDRFRV